MLGVWQPCGCYFSMYNVNKPTLSASKPCLVNFNLLEWQMMWGLTSQPSLHILDSGGCSQPAPEPFLLLGKDPPSSTCSPAVGASGPCSLFLTPVRRLLMFPCSLGSSMTSLHSSPSLWYLRLTESWLTPEAARAPPRLLWPLLYDAVIIQ